MLDILDFKVNNKFYYMLQMITTNTEGWHMS